MYGPGTKEKKKKNGYRLQIIEGMQGLEAEEGPGLGLSFDVGRIFRECGCDPVGL